jgi:HK97 family phage major capsid protein
MKKSKLDLTFREADFDVNVRKDGETEVSEIRVSVSSELPYPRELWDAEKRAYVRGYEVLGHGDGEIDFGRMKDGLVIQDTHWGDQVGLMKDIEVKDGKLTGNIIFGCGERSQEIMKDALAGIRRNMSVGYRVFEFKKDGTAEDGLPIFRAVKWQPYEASFVNVPADTDVGVGRSLETTGEEETPATTERSSEMEKPVETPAAGVTADEVREIVKEGIESIRSEIAKKPEMPEARRGAQFDEAESEKVVKRHNIMNVIRSMVNPAEKVDIGFEREVSDEIAKQNRRSAKGIFVPDVVLARAFDKGNTAGALVGTDTLFGSMIEALVAETVLGKAGVTVLDGLVGDIAIPKGAAATAYWVSTEGGDATEVNINIGQVPGTPKTVGAYTDITRKLLNQSGVSAQGFVVDALRSALGRAIEAAAFTGTGAGGQPKGLDNADIQAVTMTAGAPTKANMVEFWSKLAASNVNGNKYFIGSPAVKALLASTYNVVDGTTNGKYLCEDGKVEGYEFLMSNLCGGKKLYFGDFSQLVLAFWSGIDLTVDTSSLSKSGGVRIVAFQDCDVLVRHPEAFAAGTVLA